MTSIPKPLAETDDELLYPESDGQPMGETDWHILALISLREGLEDFFVDQADVYVASDLFLYYVEGDPERQLRARRHGGQGRGQTAAPHVQDLGREGRACRGLRDQFAQDLEKRPGRQTPPVRTTEGG